MATRTFKTNAATTNWSTAGNWVEGVVPNNADDVIFPAGTYTVQLTTASQCRTITMVKTGNAWGGTFDLNGQTLQLWGQSGAISQISAASITSGTFSAANAHSVELNGGTYGCNLTNLFGLATFKLVGNFSTTGNALFSGGTGGLVNLQGFNFTCGSWSSTNSTTFQNRTGSTITTTGNFSAQNFSGTGDFTLICGGNLSVFAVSNSVVFRDCTGIVTGTATATTMTITNCDFSGGTALDATNGCLDGGSNINVLPWAPMAESNGKIKTRGFFNY